MQSGVGNMMGGCLVRGAEHPPIIDSFVLGVRTERVGGVGHGSERYAAPMVSV